MAIYGSKGIHKQLIQYWPNKLQKKKENKLKKQ